MHTLYTRYTPPCAIRLSASATTVQCLYCLASHEQVFYQISAKLSHSCSNSIDTAVLDYSRLLHGCEGEIQTSLSFWPLAASFTSSFTSAKVFGAIIPDRGPLQLSTPSLGRQCSLDSQWSATPTKATRSAYARVYFGSH